MATVIKALVCLVLLTISSTYSAKILLIPFNHGSHVDVFCKTGETLQKAGHDAYVMVARKFEKHVANYNITPLVPNITLMTNMVEYFFEKNEVNPFQMVKTGLNLSQTQVKETMLDKAFVKGLEELKFDLMIMDGGDIARYFYIIPYKLNVPFITLAPRPDPWTVRVPALPSVEGLMPMIIMNDQSNIFHRLANTFATMLTMVIVPPSPLAIVNDDIIGELLPEKENIGFAKLYHKSEMIINNMDIICLDFHRVSSPYYKFIGGIGARDPNKPLPKMFSDIMDRATNGVVILTFGSSIKTMKKEMLQKFLDVFKDLKQEVIMRHSEDVKIQVPSNVHFTDWMPQNDLLAHPKSKLFITHAGNNGQLEAVYHGVPMLMMPLFTFGDQVYNSWRAELKGYGKSLNLYTFTTAELKETIAELLNNKTYSDNIKKCSKILHSLPSGQSQVLFWVNHVLEFGGSHLKPFYLDMPLWQYFMFDVMLVFTIIFAVFIYIMKFCYRKCCRSKQKKHEKNE